MSKAHHDTSHDALGPHHRGAHPPLGGCPLMRPDAPSGAEEIKTLVADPPWPFKDRLPGGGRGAGKHYRLMSIPDICRVALPPLAGDSRLFLWVPGAFLRDAFTVMDAWGFRDTGSQLVWHKLGRMGMGRRLRMEHEYVLLGERGRPAVLSHSWRSVLATTPGRHSEKPEAFYDQVEMFSPGPYADWFARRQRPGWVCWGDELEEE